VDIEKYIASGIIESYVLGIASSDEAQEVEALAAKHPEIKKEIASVRDALESYALAHQKTLPAHLKKKILNEIDKLDSGKENNRAKVIEMDTRREIGSGSSRWLAAASIALLVLSGTMNLLQFNKLNDANQKIAALESEKSVLANEFNTLKANYTQQENDLAILSNPLNKTIIMKGVEKQPDALASIYWNAETKEVFLAVNNLPKPPADKQYQLWAIVNGKPVDMGVFDVIDSLQRMSEVEAPQAFAVTLEKKGGSAAPTLEQMYLLGNI